MQLLKLTYKNIDNLAPYISAILNDPNHCDNLLGSVDNVAKHFNFALEGKGNVYIAIENKQVIGVCELDKLGLLALSSECIGYGMGREILASTMDYENVTSAEFKVRCTNTVGTKFAKKHGVYLSTENNYDRYLVTYLDLVSAELIPDNTPITTNVLEAYYGPLYDFYEHSVTTPVDGEVYL